MEERSLTALKVLQYYADIAVSEQSYADFIRRYSDGFKSTEIFAVPDYKTPEPGELWPIELLNTK